MENKRVYLAHSISTRGEFDDSKRVASKIRSLGYDVYVASDNDSINDKSNEPTPIDVYNGDVSEILACDIFVVNISGGLQDGTISEVGVVSGLNEANTLHNGGVFTDIGTPSELTIKPIVGYTSNARLQQPQFYEGIPSAGANHLVLGMVQKWGTLAGTEANMYEVLKEMR